MFVLPIKSTYVAHWGTWEAVREILQNAKDEEEENGHPMAVKYRAGWLRVSNLGASLSRKALLLGETSKASRPDLRGKFGEGLDLALLAGVRSGYDMRVHTRTEVWTPTIEHVEKFEAEVLVVRSRTLPTPGLGVEVRIKMPRKDWEDMRKLFRFLDPTQSEHEIRVEKGTILLHPDQRGQIYVKGIYACTVPSLHHGYDLPQAKLDRDRRMIDVWDLRWELAYILREGVEKHPDRLAPAVYQMLKTKAEDVQSLGFNTSDEFAETMAEHFREEHGTEAVPVESMAQSQQLDHLGAQGVVVSDTLRKVLERKVRGAEEVRRELATATTQEYSWHELSEEERHTLSWATELVHDATADLRAEANIPPLLERLTVVDFRREELKGTCNTGSGKVALARRALVDPQSALCTLIHEEAHAMSYSGDGTHSHIGAVEAIWCNLYFAKEQS